eukprot:GEMP01027083.1.p1 GENE.GEMP01027083.1~~GEMP01027083.1.p1  ORF type:complete len:240 (+),score=46.89 GEMP01027083.1:108-827(+)
MIFLAVVANVVVGAIFLASAESETMDPQLRGPLARLQEDFRLVKMFLSNPSLLQTHSLSLLEEPDTKTKTVKVAPKEKQNQEDGVKDMLEKAKNVPVAQMPLLLGFLKEMYDRFKHNIAKANEMEAKSKTQYKRNMTDKAKWPKRYFKDKAMMNLASHWEKQRELSHRHYHNMLKLSHAGMARLKVAIDMMEKAIAGKALGQKEMQTLKEMAPEVVLTQLSSIVQFSCDALAQFRSERV